MSQVKDGCENSNVEDDGSDKDFHEDISSLEKAEKNFDELTVTENTESGGKENQKVEKEELFDEGDGLLKSLRKIGSAILKKTGSKTIEMEPYTTTQENWTYSAISDERREDGGETAASEEVTPKNNEQTVDISESDHYNFTHKKRGYLLLIINEKFYKQATRTGAHLDFKNMKEIARKFGFKILNKGAKTNMTKSKTLEWLNKAQTMDHSRCDCFLFMISTHGLEQRNPRMGGGFDHALVCADDQLIFTSSIVEMFNETNCPSLKGKPKIFIVQACRGNSVDHGSELKISSDSGKFSSNVKDRKAKSDQVSHEPSDVTDTKGAPDSWHKENLRDIETPYFLCHTDMLIMYAIPPGMLAWRNKSDGSWMIHYMHKILMDYDMEAPKCFLKVLTKISRKMARRSTDTPSMPEFHEKKAVPVIEHMLTRDILFSSKH